MTGFLEHRSPDTDARFAFIPKLMTRPDLVERSLRQGIMLLFLDARGVLAALVFKDRLFGLLCLPFDPKFPGDRTDSSAGEGNVFSPDVLMSLLDDFRLGWLPPEKAQNLGGHIWRPIELPAEAEGFAPMFAVGPLAQRMQGRARVLDNI